MPSRSWMARDLLAEEVDFPAFAVEHFARVGEEGVRGGAAHRGGDGLDAEARRDARQSWNVLFL